MRYNFGELVYEKVNSFTFTSMRATKETFDKTFCGAECLFGEIRDAQALGWRPRTQKEAYFWWRQGGAQVGHAFAVWSSENRSGLETCYRAGN